MHRDERKDPLIPSSIFLCRALRIRVDDDDLVQPAIPRGYKVNNKGRIAYRHVWLKEDEEENLPEDERTMNLLKDIANTIYSCVQFTMDCPSSHQKGKVPVLDLKVYIFCLKVMDLKVHDQLSYSLLSDLNVHSTIVRKAIYGPHNP